MGSRIGKAQIQKLAAEVLQNFSSVRVLLELTLHPNHATAFRAAWLLETVVASDPSQFLPYVPEFISKYPEVKNHSCQRHYTKIVMTLGREMALPATELSRIVEATFEWLIDARTPVAVKVNCFDILFIFRHHDDWIADELKAQIETLMKCGSPAVLARGKVILQQLQG